MCVQVCCHVGTLYTVVCTLEVRFKTSNVVFLLHYSHCTNKTAPKHDATTTMLNRWYGVLEFECLTLVPSNVLQVKLSSRRLFSLIHVVLNYR